MSAHDEPQADKLRDTIDAELVALGTSESVTDRVVSVIKVQTAINALLALRASPETGWQPMETAPKDGQDVMLFFPSHAEEYRILICHYLFDGWYQQDADQCPNELTEPPTHWQPLPPSPRPQEAE